MFMNILCAMHMMTSVPSMIWKCMRNIWRCMNNSENMWKCMRICVVCLWIYCVRWAWWLQCPPIRQSAPSPPLLSNHLSPCADHSIEMLIMLRRWKTILMYNDKKSHHTVPAQKSKISKQMIGGKVLNFFLCKDHKTTLIFARLSYYFTPYNRLTDDSLQTGSQAHKVVHASLGSLFGQQDLYFPANHWKLTDIFFPIWALWRRCAICCPQGIGLLRK